MVLYIYLSYCKLHTHINIIPLYIYIYIYIYILLFHSHNVLYLCMYCDFLILSADTLCMEILWAWDEVGFFQRELVFTSVSHLGAWNVGYFKLNLWVECRLDYFIMWIQPVNLYNSQVMVTNQILRGDLSFVTGFKSVNCPAVPSLRKSISSSSLQIAWNVLDGYQL